MKIIEKIIRFAISILGISLLIITIVNGIQNYKVGSEYIKYLEQNNIEQTEEKEVYINRCKTLEDLMKENGITLDKCECR